MRRLVRIRRVAKGRRSARDDDGAVLLEFALALPFLVVIALGLVEMGLGWMSATGVTSAARNAARAGSSAPVAVTADYAVLESVATSLNASDLAGLKRVVIFGATTADGTVPTYCSHAALSVDKGKPSISSAMGDGHSECNLYGPQVIQWIATHPGDTDGSFGGTTTGKNQTVCSSKMLDNQWCPNDRTRSLAKDNLEYLGVYIELEHASVTHAFGDFDIKRTAVFRLEPSYGVQ